MGLLYVFGVHGEKCGVSRWLEAASEWKGAGGFPCMILGCWGADVKALRVRPHPTYYLCFFDDHLVLLLFQAFGKDVQGSPFCKLCIGWLLAWT